MKLKTKKIFILYILVSLLIFAYGFILIKGSINHIAALEINNEISANLGSLHLLQYQFDGVKISDTL